MNTTRTLRLLAWLAPAALVLWACPGDDLVDVSTTGGSESGADASVDGAADAAGPASDGSGGDAGGRDAAADGSSADAGAEAEAEAEAESEAECDPLFSQSWSMYMSGSSDCPDPAEPDPRFGCYIDPGGAPRCDLAGDAGTGAACVDQTDCRAGYFCTHPPLAGDTCCPFCPPHASGAAYCPPSHSCCPDAELPSNLWVCLPVAACP